MQTLTKYFYSLGIKSCSEKEEEEDDLEHKDLFKGLLLKICGSRIKSYSVPELNAGVIHIKIPC